MKRNIIIPLLLVCLSSCNASPKEGRFTFFDTKAVVRLYEGNEENIKTLSKDFSLLDRLSDNYLSRDIFNVYEINKSNDVVSVDPALYDLLKTSFTYASTYKQFNPLCGSLTKKWKEALKDNQVLSQEVINAGLEKINNTTVEFLDNYQIQRTGEAEIDLGAVAKGYALDGACSYLSSQNIHQYLVNLGDSSILLGEKNTDDGLFTIKIKNLDNSYLKLKNCYISTSSISEQGKKIGDVTYSHIVNPVTGSVVNLHDAVIVITSNGALGDILSTAMMNYTIEEIKQIEQSENVKCIVIKDNAAEYCHEGINIVHE